jgi:hypothetical protein
MFVPPDYGGIALLITAIGSFTTVAMQLITVLSGQKRDKKLVQIHELVNGVSHELQDANNKVAFNEGEKSGAIAERAAQASPHTPD